MQININKLRRKTNIYFRNKKLKYLKGEIKKLQIHSNNNNTCIIQFYIVIHYFMSEYAYVENCDTFPVSQSVGRRIFFLKLCTSWTYQHVPYSAHTVSTKKLLRMDRYGPKHVKLTPEY